MKELLIAIDQGGSKTDLVIFSLDGKLLLRTNDKFIRLEHIGSFEGKRWYYIEKLITGALELLDASVSDIAGIVAALCGADWQEDYRQMQEELARRLHIPQEIITIVNDCVAALRGGQPINEMKQNSAVIYAGTMFNCALESSSGKSYTYGRMINADDHGAFAIGKQVWNAIIDAYNGFQEPTIMTNILLEKYDADSVQDICEKFTSNSLVFQPITFASVLFQAIEREDMVAKIIFSKFANRWTRYVINGAHLVGFTAHTVVSLYLAGGVFKNCPQLWLKEIEQCLNQYKYNIDCSLSKLEPVAGAMLLLLEKFYQRPLCDQVIDNIVQSDLYSTLVIDSDIM